MLIPSDLAEAHVCDLVGVTGNWNWELMDWLPDEIKLQIAAIHPPIIDVGEDKFESVMLEDSSISVSRIYQFLEKDYGSIVSERWISIWKLRVPDRVKCFIWLVKHCRTPIFALNFFPDSFAFVHNQSQ